MSQSPKIKHLAPVLVVERVEPCVDFWVNRLGFVVENQVPGDDGALVFASLIKDGVEIMYQTAASVLAENPAAEINPRASVLFLTVEDLDAIERAVEGAPVAKPRHKTFYGSTELYVRDPAGALIGFAQF